MANRGPKPKTAAKSRRRTSKSAPILTVPGHLGGRVREEYARVAGKLAEEGRLEVTDPRLIELYAVNYDLARTAKEELDRDGLTLETGKGAILAHPMLAVLNAATIRLRGLIADLGLNRSEAKPASGGESKWAGLLSVTG